MVGAAPATTSPATKRITDVVRGRTGPARSHQAPTATIPMTLVASVPENATA